jgi:hypothetical protein
MDKSSQFSGGRFYGGDTQLVARQTLSTERPLNRLCCEQLSSSSTSKIGLYKAVTICYTPRLTKSGSTERLIAPMMLAHNKI